MGALATNGAVTTISASINATATQIVLAGGTGELFPAAVDGKTWFFGTLYDADNNVEIVKVTQRSGDTLTVLRGQDGTTAHKYDAGAGFDLRPTAALFNDKVSEDTLAEKAAEINEAFTSADSAVTKTLQSQIDSVSSTVSSLSTKVTANQSTVTSNYYTKSDADGRYLLLTGGTVTGDLKADKTFFSGGYLTANSGARVNGDLYVTGQTQSNSFRSTSDRRLKTDIRSMNPASALSDINRLKPVRFKWKGEHSEVEPDRLGLIAQDAEKVIPEAVGRSRQGIYSVDYSCVSAVLIAAIQQLSATVDRLQAEVNELKERK